MKKLLIATAALAMVAGTVQAQSSVSVYGLIDMGYNATEYTNNNNVAAANGKHSTMGAISALSSSRLGFRGTEDLGGGTTANFVLELGLLSQGHGGITAASTGATTGTNLDTTADKARIFTVGLSDKALGTVRIGRDKTPAQLAVEKYTAGQANNSVGEFFLYGTNATDFGNGANVADFDVTSENFGERVSAGVFYTSPTFNGLTLNVLYAKDDVKDNDGAIDAATTTNTKNQKTENTGFSIAYDGIANLSLTYALHSQKLATVGTTATAKNDLQTFGASYKLASATLFGQWLDAKKKSAAGAQTVAQNGYQVGVGYTMGKTYLWAQTGVAEQEAAAGVNAYDRKGYQLGSRYDLSKRTSLYGIYGSQQAEKAGSPTNEVTALNLGVRHSF
jgi:predicted porin